MTSEIIRNLIKGQKTSLFLEATTKKEVLEEIAEKISLSRRAFNKDEILNGLIERESKASTGVDLGVAIPHTSLNKVNETELFLFLSKKGVSFDSLDSKPSRLFFVILSPKQIKKTNHTSSLKIMASICRTMRIETIRTRMLSANNLQDILISLENG